MGGSGFVTQFLESLEDALVGYLVELREKASTLELAPIIGVHSLTKNAFQLQGNVRLDPVESVAQNASLKKFRLRYPKALLIWNLSGIYRKMTHHLCSVWNLFSHSELIDIEQVASNSPPVNKVVVIQATLADLPELPVFPVAKNLISILSNQSSGTRIRYNVQDAVSDAVVMRSVKKPHSEADSGFI